MKPPVELKENVGKRVSCKREEGQAPDDLTSKAQSPGESDARQPITVLHTPFRMAISALVDMRVTVRWGMALDGVISYRETLRRCSRILYEAVVDLQVLAALHL